MTRPGLMIAVVDDEEPVRKALRRLFRSAGMRVETFASGQEALTAMKSHSPDCLVLDLHMPGLTGMDVLRHLGESGARVPTIVITGHDQPGVSTQAMAAGASAYLNKPLDENTLLAAVAEAVRGGNPLHQKSQDGESTRPASQAG